MSAYVPNAAIAAMATLSRSLVAAEFGTAIINAASDINIANVRAGTVIPSRKLEFPTVTAMASDSAGHRFVTWYMSGVGRPVIWEGNPGPPWRLAEYYGDCITDTESQRYVNTLCVITAPSWQSANAASPRWRFVGAAVSVTALTTSKQTETSADDKRVIPDDQALADDLTVRVHRIPYAGIRARSYGKQPAVNPIALRSADFVNDKVDAGAVASKKGMTARPRSRYISGNVPMPIAAYRHSKGSNEFDNSARVLPASGPSVATKSFQCMTYVGPESVGQAMFVAPRDAMIFSITAETRVLYSSEAEQLPDKPNVVLPVRSYLVAATFESEYGR